MVKVNFDFPFLVISKCIEMRFCFGEQQIPEQPIRDLVKQKYFSDVNLRIPYST